MARACFGGNDTAVGVSDWLSGDGWRNYRAGMAALKGMDKMDAYGFDDGECSFTKCFQDALEGGYLAVVTYSDGEGTWYRVFENAAAGGLLTMDPAAGRGSAGDWVPVPEPTGGLLVLLGVAGLALRRRANG